MVEQGDFKFQHCVCVAWKGYKRVVNTGGSETCEGHTQPLEIKQCEQERDLELGKGPQDELQLADVAVHAQLDRGGARDAKVHGDVAVPARRRRAVGRVQAVLDPHHVDVVVGGQGLKAGGEVVGAVEDDALPAQVDKP
jgi:hypothetical protein